MENLICAKCNEKIEKEDLVECPHCWEIYHRECWEQTTNCLSCKKFNVDSVRAGFDDEDETEQSENQYEEAVENAENNETFEDFPLGKEAKNSDIAHTIMMISNAVLIIGIVLGAVAAICGFVLTRSLTGGIIGIVLGAVFAATGWVASILVNGFAELINNSQKNAHYLSRLVEKQEKKEE